MKSRLRRSRAAHHNISINNVIRKILFKHRSLLGRILFKHRSLLGRTERETLKSLFPLIREGAFSLLG